LDREQVRIPFLGRRLGAIEMAKKHFKLSAKVSTDNPSSIKPELERLFTKAKVVAGETANEFIIDAEVEGENAKELNRTLLSALRKVEKKTRLRAEWTSGASTERFFDYVSKGSRKTTKASTE